MVSYPGAHMGAPLQYKGCRGNVLLKYARSLTNPERSDPYLNSPLSTLNSKRKG